MGGGIVNVGHQISLPKTLIFATPWSARSTSFVSATCGDPKSGVFDKRARISLPALATSRCPFSVDYPRVVKQNALEAQVETQ